MKILPQDTIVICLRHSGHTLFELILHTALAAACIIRLGIYRKQRHVMQLDTCAEAMMLLVSYDDSHITACHLSIALLSRHAYPSISMPAPMRLA